LEAILHGAAPKDKHPMKGFPQVCFIKNTVYNPNIIVGVLLKIAWWNWDIEKISRNLEKIVAADLDALRNCK
jgi:hypothetical protein